MPLAPDLWPLFGRAGGTLPTRPDPAGRGSEHPVRPETAARECAARRARYWPLCRAGQTAATVPFLDGPMAVGVIRLPLLEETCMNQIIAMTPESRLPARAVGVGCGNRPPAVSPFLDEIAEAARFSPRPRVSG